MTSRSSCKSWKACAAQETRYADSVGAERLPPAAQRLHPSLAPSRENYGLRPSPGADPKVITG